MKERKSSSVIFCALWVAAAFAVSAVFAQQRPDTAWVRVVGEEDTYEVCRGVFGTPDGGVITCGTLWDSLGQGNNFAVFHRLDATGNVMWTRRSLGIYTDVYAGLLGPDHVLIVTGYGASGFRLAALNLNGDTLWTSGVPQWSTEGYCVARTADGLFAMGGNAQSSVTDAAITFFDSSGQYLYCRVYPDSVNPPFFSWWIESIVALEDSGLVFAARARSIPNMHPDGMWIARVDRQGNIVWTCRIRSGSDTVSVRVSSVIQLTDGAFLYACYFESPQRPYLVLGKVDQAGSVVWDSVYTMHFMSYPHNTQFVACADGGWAAAVTDRPENMFDYARLLRFNAQGDTLWSWSIGEYGYDKTGTALTSLPDGGFAMTGANWDYDPSLRIWTLVMKTEPEESRVSDRPSIASDQFALESVYPNPFNAAATIEFTLEQPAVVRLSLYDVLGRLAAVVYDGWTPAGQHRFPLHASNLASGEYFLQAEAGGVMQTRKIILLR